MERPGKMERETETIGRKKFGRFQQETSADVFREVAIRRGGGTEIAWLPRGFWAEGMRFNCEKSNGVAEVK